MAGRMDQATLRPLPCLYMGNYHSSTTVSCYSKIIKNFFGIFSVVNPFLKFIEKGGYDFTTTYTSYWDHDKSSIEFCALHILYNKYG